MDEEEGAVNDDDDESGGSSDDESKAIVKAKPIEVKVDIVDIVESANENSGSNSKSTKISDNVAHVQREAPQPRQKAQPLQLIQVVMHSKYFD